MFDLHRHDEFSFYDGSGKAKDLAKLAKEKGFTALGLTNHGNTSGNILHYDACKDVGIKPIMGCEGYFLPKYKPQERGYHLILLAKDIEGYRNLNIIQTKGDEQKYYNPIWTFDLLKQYHKGLICTTACCASFTSQCIIKNKYDLAEKALINFKKIFGNDLYVEIQPYTISDVGVQEKVNIGMIKLAEKLNINLVLTSDSHRGKKEDIEVYIKMHELKNSDEEYLQHVRETYAERYMPDYEDMKDRFIEMHSKDFGKRKCIDLANKMYENLEEIEDKISGNIVDDIASMRSLPIFDKTQDTHKLIIQKAKEGLKEKGLWDNEIYRERLKEEIKVAKGNNFEDYFLIVAEYVNWARKQKIGVGPGRGSGCNCLLNYALGITEVDPIYFGLDYKRFMREGKASIPDIDVDFETNRRQEVIDHIITKYEGKSCRIASYGMFKVDNLINDLIKTYDDYNPEDAKTLKKIANNCIQPNGDLDFDELFNNAECKVLNKKYENIIEAFRFLYKKIKYMGTHASGVVASEQDIFYYTAIRTDKEGNKYSAHNLLDLERIGIIKYDCLGLNTLTSICELREETNNHGLTIKDLSDKKVLDAFAQGKTNGVFQYDKDTAQKMFKQIGADNFNDVIAVSAMNRPGPLSLGVPSIYAESKETWKTNKDKPIYSDIIDDTYGCILYQEQVIQIATQYGEMPYNDADKLRKMDEPSNPMCKALIDEYYEPFLKEFTKGMKHHGIDKQEAEELFNSFLNYTFNKGHATGYALVSFEEMWYKVYYPDIFWSVKLKQIDFEKNGDKLLTEAVQDGMVVFLPHVNYSYDFSLRKVEGENIIQMGYVSIKGVGEKAAIEIEAERRQNGIFTSFDNFYDRCKSRVVNERVIRVLREQGALEFNKKVYISRVKKLNSALYSRGMK